MQLTLQKAVFHGIMLTLQPGEINPFTSFLIVMYLMHL